MTQADPLRASFKQCLSKLIEIDTRTHALRDIQVLVSQNKTTNNLRVWLSVLSQNRKKHSESEIQVIAFIIKQYGKGLLDPLDKIPSLQKTVFRVTEMLVKFFGETQQNVQMACQSAWLEIYETTLRDQPSDIKKKLLYNNLQAIINGGGGKLAQITAQIIVDGLLQRSLSREDHEFFKEIAKRTLVLFLKTTVNHSSSLTCLQTILGFFNIMNLLPLLDNIISKILVYINGAQNNSTGYKIKGEACNCFGIIGEQIDSNGVPVFERVGKTLSDMATDKVWAVQAPGRRAFGIWKVKKKQWDSQFMAKNERIGQEASQIKFESSPLENLKENVSQFPKTYEDNWMPEQKNNPASQNNYYQPERGYLKGNSKTEYGNNVWVKSQYPQESYQPHSVFSQQGPNYNQKRQRSPNQDNGYLHKNTGMGGGNNIQSVQQYYQRQKPQETYHKKMEQLRKSIYNPKSEIQFEDTVVLDEDNNFRSNPNISKNGQASNLREQEPEQENDFLDQWETVLEMAEKAKFEQSVKILLKMDDDIYFLRFFLKFSSGLLGHLTRPTSNKVLKKMLQIKKTNFMEQMLFKMAAQSIKAGVGNMLSNSQNLVIMNHLENAKKASSLSEVAQKIATAYERSLEE